MPQTLRQWEDSLRQPALCELLPVRDYLDGCIIRTNGCFVEGGTNRQFDPAAEREWNTRAKRNRKQTHCTDQPIDGTARSGEAKEPHTERSVAGAGDREGIWRHLGATVGNEHRPFQAVCSGCFLQYN